MNNLIGAIVIAAAVSGAIVYNGHQDRFQRQCLEALKTLNNAGSTEALEYKIEAMTEVYCAEWGRRK